MAQVAVTESANIRSFFGRKALRKNFILPTHLKSSTSKRRFHPKPYLCTIKKVAIDKFSDFPAFNILQRLLIWNYAVLATLLTNACESGPSACLLRVLMKLMMMTCRFVNISYLCDPLIVRLLLLVESHQPCSLKDKKAKRLKAQEHSFWMN